jgi:hypothetical protein
MKIQFEKEQLIKEYEKLSCGEIGKKYGVTDCVVMYWMEKFGIPRNKRGSAGGRNLKDITGERFGKLTVIKKTKNATTTSAKWLCQCDCGKTVEVVSGSLRRGLTTSCGCARAKRLWSGYEDISKTFWSRVVKGAELRNLPLEITIEDAWELFLKQDKKCALTGLPITLIKENFLKRHTEHTASLDRIDNKLGYIKGNVQWVHKEVNLLKNNFSEEELLFYCRKIIEHKDSRSGIEI